MDAASQERAGPRHGILDALMHTDSVVSQGAKSEDAGMRDTHMNMREGEGLCWWEASMQCDDPLDALELVD